MYVVHVQVDTPASATWDNVIEDKSVPTIGSLSTWCLDELLPFISCIYGTRDANIDFLRKHYLRRNALSSSYYVIGLLPPYYTTQVQLTTQSEYIIGEDGSGYIIGEDGICYHSEDGENIKILHLTDELLTDLKSYLTPRVVAALRSDSWEGIPRLPVPHWTCQPCLTDMPDILLHIQQAGERISVRARPEWTVSELKKKIQLHSTSLLFQGIVLEEKSTLAALGIKKQNILCTND